MNEDEEAFSIPNGFVEKLYEISGDSDKHKGVIMIAANESGDPIIYAKFDSLITELGLTKALSQHLARLEKQNEEPNDL
tara:strand:- start:1172 stop:1408 length:237 start_codon:yes stop_codon:yes gene_type:complete